MRTAKLARFPLGLAGLLAFGLMAWLVISSVASANPFTVTATGGTVAPNGTISVPIAVNPDAGESVGAAKIDVTYDASLLTLTGVTSDFVVNGPNPPITNGNLAAGNVTVVFAQLQAVSGTVATLDFQAGDTAGSAAIGVTVSQCADTSAGELECSATGDTVVIGEPPATPTDTATPTGTATGTATATATSTATVTSLPKTGGSTDSDSGASWMLPLILGAGAAAVIGSAAWTLNRARNR